VYNGKCNKKLKGDRKMQPKYIGSYWYTENGHCWINGITGGYVEQCDNGKYFRNMEKAIEHRIKEIKKLYADYNKKR